MDIRIAAVGDAPGILAVYSGYMDTSITFEYRLPSIKEFTRRIADTLECYPYLVCVESGRICGYAYAHPFQAREAYQWGAELSIYIDHGMTSHGVGTRLYGILIDLLKLQGVRTVYGCVTVPNPPSERFHEKLGFRRIGFFHRAGFKGEWHDISWFEKPVAPYDAPEKLIPFSQIEAGKVRGILALHKTVS